jgi:choline dehydrogenase
VYFYSVSLVRPHSRGTITLASPDPSAPALIRANYMQCQADLDALVGGVQLVRELTHTKPLGQWLESEILPGQACQTRDQIGDAIRQMASTGFHPAGTCRMGSDIMAVVDDELRVRAVEGLRLVDASVMPTVVNANTIATCVMIGERAADLIRKRQTVSFLTEAEPAVSSRGGARSALVRIRERRRGAA